NTYRGLPPGNYAIHVSGADEFPEYIGTPEAGGRDVPYRSRDIAFTVLENSPPLIDLGEIKLERLR
ncbi:MAG TPA: hypothetical protein VF551_08370, partial [Chthoniobacterales bacterium]